MDNLDDLKLKVLAVKSQIVDIQSNINLLIQIANDKGLPGKVAEVCQEFGVFDDYDGEVNYRAKALSIYMFKRGYIRVKVDNKCVFETQIYENGKGSIDLYKPGEWEVEIETLLKQIPERQLLVQLQSQEYTLNRLKQKWGMK